MSFQSLQQYGSFVTTPTVGRLYHYVYDAKLKDELPYWDKFPLALIADPYPDGWIGYNFHYVPQRTRKVILNELYKYMEFDPVTRVRSSYGFLKQISIFPDIKPCIKRYLTSHIKSRLFEINPIAWDEIIKMPTARWQTGVPYRGAK